MTVIRDAIDAPRPEGGPVDSDVAAAARGDRRAFERLYQIHVGRIYAVCIRMTRDSRLAEELTQDAFVRVWDKLPQFRGDSAFSTWLHRIAVSVVLESRRRILKNELRDAGPDAMGECVNNDTLPPLDRLVLHAAIARLPAGARTVLALHDFEGYTHEEIATMLDITAGGSKAQLHRARRLLREALI